MTTIIFKEARSKMYSTTPCYPRPFYVATMLYMLFGGKIPSHLKLIWTPIIHMDLSVYLLNQETIILDNLLRRIDSFLRQRVDGTTSPFLVSTYNMDVICLHTPFPKTCWEWTINSPQRIHTYHSKLWE